MNQLPLPGIPPVEEQASKEETADVLLLFDEDDAVQARIVNTIRNLFMSGPHSRDNCRVLMDHLLKSYGVSAWIKDHSITWTFGERKPS